MKRRLFNIVVCAFALVGLLAAGPTLAHAAEAPWEQSGEIEWQLDNGTLTIRPANGASSGELYDVPWENRKSEITSIVVEDEVICNRGCGGKVGPFPTLQVPGSDGTAPGSCSPDCS